MFERHYIEAGSIWNTILPLTALAVFIFVFLLAPSIRRSPEKGKAALKSFRVIAIYGRSLLGSGTISRVAIYDDFFLLVGVGHAKIRFRDAENPILSDEGIPTLRFTMNGIKVCLCGDSARLNTLLACLNASTRH
jgi:hypothetical protein